MGGLTVLIQRNRGSELGVLGRRRLTVENSVFLYVLAVTIFM